MQITDSTHQSTGTASSISTYIWKKKPPIPPRTWYGRAHARICCAGAKTLTSTRERAEWVTGTRERAGGGRRRSSIGYWILVTILYRGTGIGPCMALDSPLRMRCCGPCAGAAAHVVVVVGWWWAARDDHRVTVSERNRSMEILFSSLLSQSQLLSSACRLSSSNDRSSKRSLSSSLQEQESPACLCAVSSPRACVWCPTWIIISMVVIVAGRWSSSSASFWSRTVAIDQ